MYNKDLILQEIMTFEAVIRISKMLDQLAEGLQTLGMVKLMRLYPDIFINLFTHKSLSANDVIKCLYVPQELDDAVAIKHLRNFIMNSSEEGNLQCILCIMLTHVDSSA